MKTEYLNHSYYLNIVKNILKASFVGWITENNQRSLRIIKDKQEHFLPIGEGKEINDNTYRDLINQLISKNNDEGL